MDVREKLIKLLITAKDLDSISRQADFLIANGVTVQGDTDNRPHGRWLPQKLLGQNIWDCSECKTVGSPHWKACPVCTAIMDLEE